MPLGAAGVIPPSRPRARRERLLWREGCRRPARRRSGTGAQGLARAAGRVLP